MKKKIRKLFKVDEEKKAACKFCGTYLVEEDEELTCPQCGYMARSESNVFNLSGMEGRREEAKDAHPAAFPTSPQDALDADLGEDESLEGRGDVVEDSVQESEGVPGALEELDAGAPLFPVDPLGLRELLAQQPELLEAGLCLVANKKGEPIGKSFSSAVGEIDLLLRDGSGALVVVTVARRGQWENLVSGTLQRIGWVRKHLATGNHNVRGIVLVQHAPDNLDYVAAAVAGTIAIKTYRLALAFDDVEI